MRRSTKIILPVLILTLLPAFCIAAGIVSSSLHFSTQLVSFCNLALLVCCIFCIKQYFWPGYNIRLPFQIFNLIFIILFYSFSIPFLISNIAYYPDYSKLTPIGVLGKFFFGMNFDSLLQWVIILTSVINVLYIKKYREDYFNIGMSIEPEKPRRITEPIEEPEKAEAYTAISEEYDKPGHLTKHIQEPETNDAFKDTFVL